MVGTRAWSARLIIAAAFLIVANAILWAAAWASPASGESRLVALAEQAKVAFHRRMEPPPIQINIADIMVRDQTVIFRDYARESYDAAIDALVAEGREPGRAGKIEAALRQLVDTGRAERADAIFAEMLERKAAAGDGARREAAAAARHGVALIELPAALAPLIRLPSEALPFAPLGEKAAPAYTRAAELDPDDPWNWVVLAWLTGEHEALERAVETARRASDPRAAIAAWHALGMQAAMAEENRSAGEGHALAEQAYVAALGIARGWVQNAPGDDLAQRYLALSLDRMGDTLLAQKRYDEAGAAYEEAFALRRERAEAEPDDPGRRIDLIAAHMMLWDLSANGGNAADGASHLKEADGLYRALISEAPFEAIHDPLNVGGLMMVLVSAGLLTLLIGLIAMARYRRVIARWMKAAAKAGQRADTPLATSRLAVTQDRGGQALRLVERAAASRRRSERRSATIAGAARASRRAAWVYAIAGIAFACFGAILWLHLSDIEFTWWRVVYKGLPLAWPVVFTLALLWGPDRRRLGLLLAGYFGAMLGFCTRVALSDTSPLEVHGISLPAFAQPLYVFASEAAPTLFLLLFLNRRVRAVGPVLLTLMIILAIGSQVAMIGASTYGGLVMMSRAMAVIGDWLPVLSAVHFLGMLLFLPLGWLAIGWLRRLYDAKAFSEQTLVFDTIWLFQALILCSSTVYAAGAAGWLGLGAFAVYKLITWIGLRPLATAASGRPPARLLLLRTFGFRRRSERFFDLLGARWRYAGPIQLIAAPDLAGRSIDPDEFMDFLSGRLRHRFIIEQDDLDRRFAELDNRPDPDGRFRVNEIFCGNDTWRPVVKRLMAESDLVAMDLRGFSPANQGCLFELQSLIDIVPAARVVLLTDKSTDGAFLRDTLAACWGSMDDRSPNRTAGGAMTLLATGGRDVAAVSALLAIADDVLVTGEAAPAPPAATVIVSPA